MNISEELANLRDRFLDHIQNKLGRSSSRIYQLKHAINKLYEFMTEKGIEDISNLTQKQIILFQHYIHQSGQTNTNTVIDYIQQLDLFCRYLLNNNIIWKNPFSLVRCISYPELSKPAIKRYYNFNELLTRWMNYMRRRSFYITNANKRIRSMENFILFIKERGIKTVYKVRPETINEYKKYLSEYQYQPGLYYTPLTQIEHLRGICSFFLYLYREKLIETDPAKHIILRQLYRELDEKYRAIVPLNSRRRQSIIDNPEIKELFSKFIQYGRSKGISEDTIKNYIPAVEKFYEFINKRNILDLRKITRHDIMDYQAWLAEQKTVTGEKYNINTVLNRLISLRSFFRYLARYDYLICDPSASIELPKRARGIPNTCMTERELQILLSQPNLLYPIEFRDRAIMEVLYSTGIRAKELAGLKMGDINFAQGLLRVDEPKGGKSKQRVIPIGQTACNYVKQYIDRTRPLFDKRSTVYLFLSESGRKLARVCLSAIIRKYLFRSGIRKKITTHSFRVTCATHMIRHKAEISYVQQQLGHTNISTTQEYVRLVPRDLKEVHNRCHPREHIKID